jgi:hypothetical protein
MGSTAHLLKVTISCIAHDNSGFDPSEYPETASCALAYMQVKQEPAQADRLAAEFGACRFSRVSFVEDQINNQKVSFQPGR